MARAPAQPAPIAIPSAANSSSACTTAKVACPVSGSILYFFKYSINCSHKLDDGVMGYQVTTETPAKRAPIAQAELPSIIILPSVLYMGSTKNGSCFLIFSLAHCL